jgi:2-amino-4-hydroxy-6-hydroxymethyldihydropteridine diphosphokinase
VNGALAVTAPLGPEAILTILHEIEATFGRERQHRWGPRTVDLDLIASDDQIAPDIQTWRHWHDLPPDRQRLETPDELILPHPRMQDRAFVLVPLMDIAPDWRHPILGRTVAEMHADLTQEERSKVISLPNQACH